MDQSSRAAAAARLTDTAAEFPCYTPAERRADAAVHAAGLALGLAGCAGLAAAALARPDAGPRLLAGLGLYATGLMAMLACSALYNLTDAAAAPARKRLLRRLDRAAIFAAIAGTYTPFLLVAVGGPRGLGLLAFVWAVAAAGIAVELLGLRRSERLSVAAYLLLGWSIVGAPAPSRPRCRRPGWRCSRRGASSTARGWSSTCGEACPSRTRSGTGSCWPRRPATTRPCCARSPPPERLERPHQRRGGRPPRPRPRRLGGGGRPAA